MDADCGSIGIFVPWAHLHRTPCVLSSAILLARHGYQVDVFQLLRSSRFPVPALPSDHIRVHVIDSTERRRHGVGRIADRIPFVPRLRHLLNVSRQLPSESYTAFVGVDDGMIEASVAGLLRRTPVVFHDTELVVTRPAHTFRHRVQSLVLRYAIRRAAFAISLDEMRAEWLAQLSGLSRSRIAIVPNAPLGQASARKSNFLRRRLGISDDKKIILHAGAIARWGRCLPIAQAARRWPDDWVLVLHGFVTDEGMEIMDSLRELAKDPRIMLSLDPVPCDQVDEIYRSGDIGLALYEDRGPNFTDQTGSSGKLINSLKCGLPVIASDFPSLRRVVLGYHCGLTVSHEAEIADAVSRILVDYETYQANALHCYNELFDVERSFADVLQRLGQITSSSPM